MIKGINRQMIEVTNTGSPYFEKAFLVVRPGGSQPPEAVLQRLAEKVVRQADTYAGMRRQRRKMILYRCLRTVLTAGVGALIMWIVMRLI